MRTSIQAERKWCRKGSIFIALLTTFLSGCNSGMGIDYQQQVISEQQKQVFIVSNVDGQQWILYRPNGNPLSTLNKDNVSIFFDTVMGSFSLISFLRNENYDEAFLDFSFSQVKEKDSLFSVDKNNDISFTSRIKQNGIIVNRELVTISCPSSFVFIDSINRIDRIIRGSFSMKASDTVTHTMKSINGNFRLLF